MFDRTADIELVKEEVNHAEVRMQICCSARDTEHYAVHDSPFQAEVSIARRQGLALGPQQRSKSASWPCA